MRRMRRPIIPRRECFFVGCEGESEAGYVRLLNNLAVNSGLHIHLQIEQLGGRTGDPLGRVKRIIEARSKYEERRVTCRGSAILMDADQMKENQQKTGKAITLASQHNIQIIWQNPCHEALLLRHMPRCASLKPSTCTEAERKLQQKWPNYKKGMTAVELSRRVDLEAIKRAARVEPELREFLNQLGFAL